MFLYVGVSAEDSRQCVYTYAAGMVEAEGVLLVILVVISGKLACRVVLWWKEEKNESERA